MFSVRIRIFINIFVLIISLFFFSRYSEATTYFIAPNGSDSSAGSTSAPFKTFNKAWSVMAQGDTLILKNGTYTPASSTNTESIMEIANESNITIKAENDGGAIVDGQFAKTPVRIGYAGGASGITIEGIVGMNGKSAVFFIHNGSTNNILRRVSGYDANPATNSSIYTLWGGNNLIEDCVAVGTGRKMINSYQGGNNTVRRCFVYSHHRNWFPTLACGSTTDAYCGTPWPNGEIVQTYNSNNNIFENILATGFAPNYLFNIQANSDTAVADNNKILGSVGFKAFINPKTNKAWTAAEYGPAPSVDVPMRDWSWPGQRSGMSVFGQGTLTNNLFKDVVMYQNARVGFTFVRPYNGAGSTISNNRIENATITGNNVDNFNESGNIGGQVVLGPFTVTNSKIQNTTYNGAGADLQYRYVNGVKTNQSLWPWPMEDRIKRELRDLLGKYHVDYPEFTNYSVTQKVCEEILRRPEINAVSNCNSGQNGSPTPTAPVTLSPTVGSCALRPQGDADCSGVINLVDFEVWRKEFTAAITTSTADFNGSGKSDLVDFEIWRKSFLK